MQEIEEQLPPSNAIANAGIRGCLNFCNLYLHLYWPENAEQFIPAHAIASTVGRHFSASVQTMNLNNQRQKFVTL